MPTKPKLKGISIRRTKGGGHSVTHEYESAPAYSGATRNGGMSMQQAPAEEHKFPAGKHKDLLNHIASVLALNSVGSRPAGPGAGPNLGQDEG